MIRSRSIKVFALSTGQALSTLVALIATVVLARILTVREYATYRQTLLAYQFAAPLLTLSLPMALYYFLPGETRRKRGVLIDNLLALTFMGVVFAGFLLVGGNRLLAWRFQNPDLVEPLRWMGLYAVFALPAGAIAACLTVQSRVLHLSVFNVGSRVLTLVAVISAALVWQNAFAPVKAMVIAEAFILAVALWLMLSSVPRDDARVSVQSIASMTKYAIPLGLATVMGTITLQLDKMIVAAMCGPEKFAIYANGAMEIPLIGIVTGSIAAVILADMRVSIVKRDYSGALELFRTAASKSACLLIPAMCFLLVFAEDFITILFSEKYIGSVLPFRLYLLILPIRIVVYGSAMIALGQSKIILVRSAGDLTVNALLSILLVYMMGAVGAAIATLLTLYVWHVPFNLYHISRGFGCRMSVPLPFLDIGRTFLASVISACLSMLVLVIPGLQRWARLLLAAGMFSIGYIALGALLRAEVWHIIVHMSQKSSHHLRSTSVES